MTFADGACAPAAVTGTRSHYISSAATVATILHAYRLVCNNNRGPLSIEILRPRHHYDLTCRRFNERKWHFASCATGAVGAQNV